jgi:hypothetical protein
MPPPEFLLPALLYGVLIPAVVTALLLLPVRFCRIANALEAQAFGALATAAGFAAGYLGLNLSQLQMDLPWHWPAAALVAAAVAGSALPGWARAVLWLGVAAVAAWWVVPAALFDDAEWKPLRPWCYTVVASGVLALGALAPVARRQPGPLVPLLLAVTAAGAAIVLMQSGNAKLAHVTGALAAALGAVMILAAFAPNQPIAAGATPVVAVLLPGALAAGKFYSFSDVPLTSYVLAAAAPLGLAVPELPGLRSLPPRGQAALRALAVLALTAIPAVPAVLALVHDLQAEG